MLPDSSPALTMEEKSLEKCCGRLLNASESVTPRLTSSSREAISAWSFLFRDCLLITCRARVTERPAVIIAPKFLAKLILSWVLTPLNKFEKLVKLKKFNKEDLFDSSIETTVPPSARITP